MNSERKQRALLVIGLTFVPIATTLAVAHHALIGGFCSGIGIGLLTMSLMMKKRRCIPRETV